MRSPTYTLVEPYEVPGASGTQKVYHFDLYRFVDPEEWTDAGFRDCFAEPALCLVEWPEKAQALLGTPTCTSPWPSTRCTKPTTTALNTHHASRA